MSWADGGADRPSVTRDLDQQQVEPEQASEREDDDSGGGEGLARGDRYRASRQ